MEVKCRSGERFGGQYNLYHHIPSMYDSDDEVTLATGHAHVYRFPVKKQSQGLQPGADAEPGWIVCKQIEAGAVVPPHNLRQEVELLHSFDHDNVHLTSALTATLCVG